MSDLPNRKPNRLPDFDYNTPGYYFITICTKDKRCILGHIVGGGVFDAPQMQLSAVGKAVLEQIDRANQARHVKVDKFVIMPNHVHMILQVTDGTSRTPSPTEECYRAQLGAVTIRAEHEANCQPALPAGTSRTPSPTEECYRAQSGAVTIRAEHEANCQPALPAGTSRTPSPTNAAIPHFVSSWKRFCNKETGMSLFQRSYHDHIIRGEADYLKIWQYIDTNPEKWNEDCFYTEE